MEILLFVMDALAFAVMVAMTVRDERRPAGRPASSLFRMREPAPPGGLVDARRPRGTGSRR